MVTDPRNHAVDPLDKAADHEKAKIMAGTELMKEKGKIYGDVIRELEKTIFVLETNISAAKREVSETAEQIIAKVRERERELITTLEDTRVIMHQSIPPAPSSPPGYCGAFARHVSPGGGAFANFALPGGRAFANPGPFPSF